MVCIICRVESNKQKLILPCEHYLCSLCMYNKFLQNKDICCCTIYKIPSLPHIWYLGSGNQISKYELTDLLPNEIESLKTNFEFDLVKINEILYNDFQKILVVKGNIIFIGAISQNILTNVIAIERYSGKVFISEDKELSYLSSDTFLYRVN